MNNNIFFKGVSGTGQELYFDILHIFSDIENYIGDKNKIKRPILCKLFLSIFIHFFMINFI